MVDPLTRTGGETGSPATVGPVPSLGVNQFVGVCADDTSFAALAPSLGASARRPGIAGSRDQSSPPARLGEAQHVAGGIAEGAGADAVRHVHRLLQHLATRGADALEGGVAVVGPEDDAAQQ